MSGKGKEGKTYANGKTGIGKKNRRSTVTFAVTPVGKDDPDHQTNFTYGGNASASQPNGGNQKPAKSFAPKGSKPKAPMEVSRLPEDNNATNNSGKDKGKDRVAKW